MTNIQFVENAEAVAREAMGEVNPVLVENYVSLIGFLSRFPEHAASKMRGRNAR